MFKYTAHPDVLRKYDSISKNAKRPWDDHFFLAIRIAGSSDAYFACGKFWQHYKKCQFFSKTKVKEVPINGVLISSDWFVETKI